MTIESLRSAKSAARSALRSVPSPVWERVFPKDVLALGYHLVSDEDLPHLRLYAYKNTRQFEQDVVFAQGRTVAYSDVVSHRLRGTALPPNRFLFTFDDGFAECFHVIRPILHKYGVSGVFFVPTDFIDNRTAFSETKVSLCITEIVRKELDGVRSVLETVAGKGPPQLRLQPERAGRLLSNARISAPISEERRRLLLWLLSLDQTNRFELDWLCDVLGIDVGEYARGRQVFMRSEELKTLASEGFTVGAHGLSHHLLQTMGRAQIEHEIVTSCRTIGEITGQRHVPFAFPYTGRGIDRGFLADIIARHPFIELLFDSGPLSRGAPFLVDRVWAETPAGTRSESNLPSLLSYALSASSAWYRA